MLKFVKNMYVKMFKAGEPVVDPTPITPPVEPTPEPAPEPAPPQEPIQEAVSSDFQERARHVVAKGRKWLVKAPGKEEPLEVHDTKKSAVASARAMCQELKGELFVHGKDGKIQNRDSYGNDGSDRLG